MFVFVCLFLEVIDFLKCDWMWILVVFEMLYLVFFLFEFWYYFVLYIWVMIVFCFIFGFFVGMIVFYLFYVVVWYIKFEEREFVLGLLIIGNVVGGFMVGFVGLFVELYFRDECI